MRWRREQEPEAQGALMDRVDAALRDGGGEFTRVDLRGAPLSPESLLLVCQRLESARAAQRELSAKRGGQRGGLQGRAPYWLELGDNPGIGPDEAVSLLRGHGVSYCIPVRCSRKRCLHGAVIHLSCRARQGHSCSMPEPGVSPPQPVPSQAQKPPPPLPAPPTSAPPPPPALDVAPFGESPLLFQARAGDFHKFQHVFAACGSCGGAGEQDSQRRHPVELFEELEVLLASPLSALTTGHVLVRQVQPPFSRCWLEAGDLVEDACGAQAFGLIRSRGDTGGLCRLLELVVGRLGGRVVDSERLRSFAAAAFASATQAEGGAEQGVTYQQLLELLHDRERRNAAGIWQPGDSYGVGDACPVP